MKQILITILAMLLIGCIGISSKENLKDETSNKIESIDELSWLIGSWEGPVYGGVLEETWLPPRGNTVTAIVRLTKNDITKFVEIIRIEKIGNTLELRLQIFDSPFLPRFKKPHVFRLSKIGQQMIEFKGVSEGSHKKLSYVRISSGVFRIQIETNEGNEIIINLRPTKKIKSRESDYSESELLRGSYYARVGDAEEGFETFFYLNINEDNLFEAWEEGEEGDKVRGKWELKDKVLILKGENSNEEVLIVLNKGTMRLQELSINGEKAEELLEENIFFEKEID